MKKSLFISLMALVFSVAALVKVYYPCTKSVDAEGQAPASAPTAVAAVNVEEILNEKPEIIFNAMQRYQQKMQEEAMAEARKAIQENLKDLNEDPNSPFVGNKDADIVLVEFFDYACGYCHRLFPELNKVIANNPNVKFVFKPLAFLSEASDYAARAVLAANEQGKFVELHNALFTIEGPLTEEGIMNIAGKIGLNVEQLKADLNSDKIRDMMAANNELAGKIQVNGVPTMILNGEMLQTIDGNVIQNSIDELKK